MNLSEGSSKDQKWKKSILSSERSKVFNIEIPKSDQIFLPITWNFTHSILFTNIFTRYLLSYDRELLKCMFKLNLTKLLLQLNKNLVNIFVNKMKRAKLCIIDRKIWSDLRILILKTFDLFEEKVDFLYLYKEFISSTNK